MEFKFWKLAPSLRPLRHCLQMDSIEIALIFKEIQSLSQHWSSSSNFPSLGFNGGKDSIWRHKLKLNWMNEIDLLTWTLLPAVLFAEFIRLLPSFHRVEGHDITIWQWIGWSDHSSSMFSLVNRNLHRHRRIYWVCLVCFLPSFIVWKWLDMTEQDPTESGSVSLRITENRAVLPSLVTETVSEAIWSRCSNRFFRVQWYVTEFFYRVSSDTTEKTRFYSSEPIEWCKLKKTTNFP